MAATTPFNPPGPVRVPPVAPAGPTGVRDDCQVPEPARLPASAKAAVWAACVIAALPALWAAFLTFYGGVGVFFFFPLPPRTPLTRPPPSAAEGTHASQTARPPKW